MSDPRAEVAEFYDLEPDFPGDVPFYRRAIPCPGAAVLEIGCGTARALAPFCRSIVGVEASAAMLELARRRLRAAGLDPRRACLLQGDATDFTLGLRFDLIIAPCRVVQNLEADVDAMLRRAREHLAPDGTFVLDVFRPSRDAETLRREWCVPGEIACREARRGERTISRHERRARLRPNPLVLYPEHVYRVHGPRGVEREVRFSFPVRCYYPDEIERRVEAAGLRVVARWGGYSGEFYGEGPELLLGPRSAVGGRARLASGERRGEIRMERQEQDRRMDYIEFTVGDLDASRRFFESAFGWRFTDYGPDYTSFSDGRLQGGLRRATETLAGGPLVVLYAVDLEAARRAIVAAGGTVVVDPFGFPGGRRFQFKEPSGVELAVWSER